MTRQAYKAAYRNVRLLNYGTIFFGLPGKIAHAIVRQVETRNAEMYTAKMFWSLGYYAKGWKRI